MKTPLILDSTLREGEQTPGVCFALQQKIDIAQELDEIGIDIIEAGHPAATKNIYEAVKKISSLGLKAKIAAHSRSCKEDIDLALECNVDFIGIFYCVSNARLNNVFKKSLEEATKLVSDIIRYAKSKKNDLIIRYTPEDTVRSNFRNVIKISHAAVEAGADIISIADTTGHMFPGKIVENAIDTTKIPTNMHDYTLLFKKRLNDLNAKPEIEVHCHNDLGFALANSIDAFKAGADIIDSSILGLGERAGITDTAQLLSAFALKYNISKWRLNKLYKLYQKVSEYSKISIPKNFPLMGEFAFTHCAGVHTNAVCKDPKHYQDISPEIFGRESQVALGHMSGISSVKYRLEKLNLKCTDEQAKKILDIIKQEGEKGLITDKRLKEIYGEFTHSSFR